MPVNVYPANLQWVGAAKETTYGTPVAAPTFWIPVDGSSVKWKPNQTMLKDQNIRGMMGATFQQVAGMRYDTLDYKTNPYLDSLYQHFLALLGRPDAITGSSDPYTHKTSLENGVDNATAMPPSSTLFWFDGVKCVQIPGCILGSLGFDVKVDEPIAIDASWMGLPATVMTTAPSNTPTTAKPWPSWNSIITLASTVASPYSEVNLTYKRDTQAVETVNDAQTPLQIFAGTVTVTGALTAVFQGSATDVNLVDYLTNVQPSLVVQCAPVGDATHYIKLQHTVVAFDSAEPSGGSKWMEISANVEALMNATDALDSKESPCQVVFLTPASTAF